VIDASSAEHILCYLYHVGYLTQAAGLASVGSGTIGSELHEVVIPNNETKMILLEGLENSLIAIFGFSLKQLDTVATEVSMFMATSDNVDLRPLKEAFEALIGPIKLGRFESEGKKVVYW
jgi:hypothetical protein